MERTRKLKAWLEDRIRSIRRRSRIVAAPRLLFENTSTWTCLTTRFRWQVHDKQSRISSNFLLHQQRGQNILDQRYQSTVSLRIASLAATGINKRRTNSGDEINSTCSVWSSEYGIHSNNRPTTTVIKSESNTFTWHKEGIHVIICLVHIQLTYNVLIEFMYTLVMRS